MVGVTPIFAGSDSSSESNFDDERLRLARSIIQGLSPETRAILARELGAEQVMSKHDLSATGVIATVLKLVPHGKAVTAASLRQEVAKSGMEAEPKEVYNAITYLARTGKLRRVGYGRYVVNGIEIGTSDLLGGERSRDEDLSDGD